jgi:hypothetical protein
LSGRLSRAASAPRELLRLAYRDPEHLCERMTLFASSRLAGPSRDWAQRAQAAASPPDRREIAHDLRSKSARVAALEGAVAGTPFYAALVPGYINYLWQELRMTLRLAALYDRDPAALGTAAEALWLRGVYPNVEAAQAGLEAVQSEPVPQKPESRRSFKLWVASVQRVLVFGGFMSPPRERHSGLRYWARTIGALLLFAIVWVVTWLFPGTCMLAMAYGCGSHARRLSRAASEYYSGEAAPTRSPREKAAGLRPSTIRDFWHGVAIFVSIVVPIGFLVYATHVSAHSFSFNLLRGVAVLVAISVVLAVIAYSRR